MNAAAGSLGRGQSHPHGAAKAAAPEPPKEVVRDLNKVTGLHFSKATWGFLWTVVLGAAGWATNMKIESGTTATKLDSLVSGQVKADAKLERMDGKLERFGERLTRVEIQVGRKHTTPDDEDVNQ